MTLYTPWHPPPGLTLCNPPMTEPTPLSPAAQAVLDAANGASSYDDVLNDARLIAAAALRAAADQVAPERFTSDQSDIFDDFDMGAEHRNQEIRDDLLAIATELKGMRDD